MGVKTAGAQREQQKLLLPPSLPSSLLIYGYAYGSSSNNHMMINSSSSPSSYLSGQLLSLPPEIFARVKPSVVQITPISSSHGQHASSLLGSGFVYDKEGHILTNSHIVDEAAFVVVTLVDGNQYNSNVI